MLAESEMCVQYGELSALSHSLYAFHSHINFIASHCFNIRGHRTEVITTLVEKLRALETDKVKTN